MRSYLPPTAHGNVDAELLVKNPLIVDGDAVRILLHGGEVALIDLADLPAVAHLRWTPDGLGYARCRSWCNGKLEYPRLHRFLFGPKAEGWYIDHINGRRWDCRRANLRLCSRSQNVLNRAPNVANRTGFKGVQRHKSGFYFVQIKHCGQQYRVGNYETPEEAARAYDFLAGKWFGKWARLNFPGETLRFQFNLAAIWHPVFNVHEAKQKV